MIIALKNLELGGYVEGTITRLLPLSLGRNEPTVTPKAV